MTISFGYKKAEHIAALIPYPYLSKEWKDACLKLGYDFVVYHLTHSCGHELRIIFEDKGMRRAKQIEKIEGMPCRICKKK